VLSEGGSGLVEVRRSLAEGGIGLAETKVSVPQVLLKALLKKSRF